jgi:hypothetical protein
MTLIRTRRGAPAAMLTVLALVGTLVGATRTAGAPATQTGGDRGRLIGVRFYTYIWTMYYAMEAAAEHSSAATSGPSAAT